MRLFINMELRVWKTRRPISRDRLLIRTEISQRRIKSLWWRHNGRDGVSNHQPHDCLLECLFTRRSKKTSKLRVTGLCAGNSLGTDEFPAQLASNMDFFPFDDVIMCRAWIHASQYADCDCSSTTEELAKPPLRYMHISIYNCYRIQRQRKETTESMVYATQLQEFIADKIRDMLAGYNGAVTKAHLVSPQNNQGIPSDRRWPRLWSAFHLNAPNNQLNQTRRMTWLHRNEVCRNDPRYRHIHCSCYCISNDQPNNPLQCVSF